MGPFGGFAHEVLELGEDLLDRIEVGAIGRQEQEPGADAADRFSDGRSLVAREVVHDDDIAWRERRNEALFDIVGEALAVDRLIEHARCVDAVAAQRREEGHRTPVAIRDLGMKPFADRRPASQGRHVRLRPGFVDEDEASRIKPALILFPLLSPSCDRGSKLFGGQNAFF